MNAQYQQQQYHQEDEQIPMDPLDHAIRLNNEGVRQTVEGNDDQAVALFSKALCVMKSLISQDTSNDNTPSRGILHSGTTALPRFEGDGRNFFLFNNVILFTRSQDPTPADNHVYCAAIILNIAIVYHRQAVLGHQDALIKAERFYDMVTKIIAGNCDENQGTGLVVRLAAVNNLSQIHYEQGNYQAAEEGFQLLAWLVTSCSEAADEDGSSVLDTQELEGMLLNVLMANRQTAAAAA